MSLYEISIELWTHFAIRNARLIDIPCRNTTPSLLSLHWRSGAHGS